MSFQALAKIISVMAQGQFAELKMRATDKPPGAKWNMAYLLLTILQDSILHILPSLFRS